MGIVSWLIIGLIAGWLTGKIMGGGGKGALMDIIIGLVGALCGGFVVSLFGMRSQGGFIYTLIVATFGAVLLTWIVRKVRTKQA